jgi:hypothetical protein
VAATLAEVAREAYAAGVALSGGPVTERVRHGCEAAVAVALESPDDPRVLEVSLHLGHLEGTWARVYQRREDLTAKHIESISAIWRRLVKRLDPEQLTARYRRELIMMESDGDGKPDGKQKAAARASALWWLSEIMSDPEFRDLPGAVTEALAEALAEGKTAALAIAADQASKLGFDWATAYDRMYAGLTDLGSLPGMSATWVQDILGAASADAGRALAAAAAAGKSDAEQVAAVLDEVGSADPESVALMVDYAMGGSFTRGALDLYLSEGLTLVAFMTASDGRVCPGCQDCEDNGPYSPYDVPQPPMHPRCRCCLAPSSPLPVSAFADFLIPPG